jgi:hypothetical protein
VFGRIKRLADDVGQLNALEGEVRGGDQRVRLAAAEASLQPVDGRHGVVAGQPAEDLVEDAAQAVGGVRRLREELLGVGVEVVDDRLLAPVEVQHLGQGGGEDLRVERTAEDVGAGLTGLKDRAHEQTSGREGRACLA